MTAPTAQEKCPLFLQQILPNELLTTIYAELAHFPPLSGVRFLAALVDRDLLVDDLAAVRAVANR